jgi:hypothetical protein
MGLLTGNSISTKKVYVFGTVQILEIKYIGKFCLCLVGPRDSYSVAEI